MCCEGRSRVLAAHARHDQPHRTRYRRRRAAFVDSVIHQDAVLRNLDTLTESTQKLSTDLKAAHPEIDWVALAAFRNVVVHDYLGIDMELVWTVVTLDVPDLKAKVTKLLDSVP